MFQLHQQRRRVADHPLRLPGDTGETTFVDTTDVNLLVSAGVTMKATPTKVRNRHATVFTGRLLGGPVPRRGVVIDLQVFFRKHWRTFAAPRTNRRGVYRFKYRFMAGAATWRFRARVRRACRKRTLHCRRRRNQNRTLLPDLRQTEPCPHKNS